MFGLRLKKESYQPLNKVLINSKNLLDNYRFLLSLDPKQRVAPVLKSNAYGHGIVEVAKILDSGLRQNDKISVPFFCVDSLFEAYQLLKAGIKTPILIMGFVDPENLKIKKLPFSYTVFNLETAKLISQFQPGASVHAFVDSGMNREGIKLEELEYFLKDLKKLDLKIEGLMSHLASASSPKDPLAKNQIKNFQKTLEIGRRLKIKLFWKSLNSSNGLLNLDTPSGNLSRVGLALYGLAPDAKNAKKSLLKPVLSLITKIVQIKKISKGEKVGYDGSFIAKRQMVIGILPLGYNDGVDRRLSNKGQVKVGKIYCQIIGKVSMNITTVDLSDVNKPFIGQEVKVFSENREDKNSIENAAIICRTIPYELLVRINPTIRRKVLP